jgi:DNA-binding MarR family transcriptional regulator/GNAT superfamily N-acetyltransferase
MGASALDRRILSVRKFNRFYTQKIGVLGEGLYESPFSLTEVRILYELSARGSATASELARDLALDAGYLSRILKAFRRDGLIAGTPAKEDARRVRLTLTAKGQETFAPLDRRSHDEVGAALSALPAPAQARLVRAMRTIEEILGGGAPKDSRVVLRPPMPGDLGWVVHRHGALYAAEYGWDERFEAVVAKIAGEFVENLDPRAERCWMAEKDGEIVGSVFLVRKSKTVARLRLLYVEPSERGFGIGKRLVAECVRFARRAGYRTITLWTQSVLTAARRIYERQGFRLVASESNRISGQDLVAETWELDLRRPRNRPAVP